MTGQKLEGDSSLLCMGRSARLVCYYTGYKGKSLLCEKCCRTFRLWLCPASRMPTQVGPFVGEHHLPILTSVPPSTGSIVKSFHASFRRQGKDTHVINHKTIHEAPPSQKRGRLSKHCPTPPYSLPQLWKLRPSGHNLGSFFIQRRLLIVQTQKWAASSLPPKGNSKHKKGKTNPQPAPPPQPTPLPK